MSHRYSEEKALQWKENILKQRTSGLNIVIWCRSNNINLSSFHYWKDKLFPKTAPLRSQFAEIVQENEKPSKGIILEYRGFTIRLSKHFDASLLKDCIQALKQC